MSATFTPFVLPASAKPAAGAPPPRTTVVSATPAAVFKPYGQVATTPDPAPAPLPAAAPTPNLPPPTSAAAAGNPAPANPCVTLPAPTVTYVQADGQITRIRIQCACGSVTELECVY